MLAVAVLYLDTGLACRNQEKLTFVAEETAVYIANLPVNTDLVKLGNEMVSSLLKENKIACSKTTTVIKSTHDGSHRIVSVGIETNCFYIRGSVLPSVSKIKVCGSAIVNGRIPFAYVCADAYPYCQTHENRDFSNYLPVVRPDSLLPLWTFQQDATIGSIYQIRGRSPTVSTSANEEDCLFGRESIY